MNGLHETLLVDVVEAAVRAPSSDNTQPWLFRRTDAGLLVVVDRSRALPGDDPDDRELLISCGAVIAGIEVAAHHVGHHARVTLLPQGGDDDVVADIAFVRGPPSEHDRFAALWARRTIHGPFSDQPVPATLLPALAAIAATTSVSLAVIEGLRRELLIDLVAIGDEILFDDHAWRDELIAWGQGRRAAPDGGGGPAHQAAQLARGAPVIVLVSTATDLPEDWLTTGIIMHRLLLEAAVQGVQAGFLNQPCQLDNLRHQLRHTFETRWWPQVVLRLGHPVDLPGPTPRRPVAEMIVARTPTAS